MGGHGKGDTFARRKKTVAETLKKREKGRTERGVGNATDLGRPKKSDRVDKNPNKPSGVGECVTAKGKSGRKEVGGVRALVVNAVVHLSGQIIRESPRAIDETSDYPTRGRKHAGRSVQGNLVGRL